MKKVLSIMLTIVIILSIFTIIPVDINAAAGIANNGIGGIYIDINAAPYTDSRWYEYGDPYGSGGCTWFVGARVMQLTGKGSYYTQNCSSWYYSYGPSLGFNTGSTPQAPAVICYSGHVAFLEKIEGNTAYISEGGVNQYKHDGSWQNWASGNSYTAIHRIEVGEISSWCGYRSDFLGYVYLGNVPAPNPKGHVMSESEGAGQTIPDGDYWICSRIAANYFLDLSGNYIVEENGTNVHMWTLNDVPGKYDVFHLKYLNNGFYQISQMGSNMGLDIESASMECGANVHMWTNHSGTAHQWSIELTSKGYQLRSRHNSFYMDIAGGAYADGTNVQVWESNSTDSQYYSFIPYVPDERPINDGIYMLESALSKGLFLDASGQPGSYSAKDNIHIWKDAGETFQFQYASNGYYKIHETSSQFALEFDTDNGSYLDASKNVRLNQSVAGKRQLWTLKQAPDGYFYLINKLSGYCLDVRGGKAESGTNVETFPYNGTPAQKWKPIRVLQDDMVTVSDVEINSESEVVDPNAIVMVDGKKLTANTDYTVQVTTDIANGKGTVTVTGKGNYCDTVTKDFKITYIAPSILGDVDGDGDVSAIDATYVIRYSAQIDVQLDEAALMRGDVDGNEEIEIVDATYIQRYLAEFDIPFLIGEPI